MTKNLLKKSIFAAIIFIMFLVLMQTSSNAAGFSVSAGKTTMTTGETTNFTLSVTDALGLFTITSSDNSVVSISGSTSPWLEGTRK